jgi:hypothetical protein
MAHDQGVVSIKLGNISVPYVSSTGQRAKFTFLSRSASTSRTANSEHTLWAEFFCNTNLHVQKLVNQKSAPFGRSPPS